MCHLRWRSSSENVYGAVSATRTGFHSARLAAAHLEIAKMSSRRAGLHLFGLIRHMAEIALQERRAARSVLRPRQPSSTVESDAPCVATMCLAMGAKVGQCDEANIDEGSHGD